MSRSDPRLYVVPEEAPFQTGAEIALAAGQAHYLGNVMRASVGQHVSLFNGRDGEWKASIEKLRKDRATVRLLEKVRTQSATVGIELLFAPLKRDATELVVRMGTELGVVCFRPVITERTNTHRINMDRLSLIAQEAAEQCERLDVPEIKPLVPLKDLMAGWPRDKTVFAAFERSCSDSGEGGLAAALLIGPEGGFSPAELSFLETHSSVHAFSLGPLILKAETAACAGLACLAALRR